MVISDDKRADIALKYLDLARAEILYRVKSSNDTLVVFAGATGAIAAWLYKTPCNPTAASGLCAADSIDNRLLFPAGCVLAFLSLAASWIISHNERMVCALAEYQRVELGTFLNQANIGFASWELSASLPKEDSRRLSTFTSAIYALLIVGPSVLACCLMAVHYGQGEHPILYLSIALIMTSGACATLWHMVVARRKLRPAPVPKPKPAEAARL
jgi:hypothetical protein